MRKVVQLIFAFLCTAPYSAAQTIPPTFFGMHINRSSSYPLKVPYGNFRGWDGNTAQWQRMSSCPSPNSSSQCQTNPSLVSYDWTNLDQELVAIRAAGVSDVLYTLARTPQWASSKPSSTDCEYGSGSCYLPPGLNADGSGANAIWDSWVTNIAAHVNSGSYLATHSHVKYWEPWNEVFFDDLIYSGAVAPFSIHATYAQLLRLTEDTRCIIVGRGTIHNYPAVGNSTACSAYLSSMGQSAIDPNAIIVMPSQSPYDPQIYLMQNFLYCNKSPIAGSNCNWGGGLNWGSASIDVVNFHLYLTNQNPEFLSVLMPRMTAFMTAGDKAKPLWNGEGSMGGGTGDIWADGQSQMAYVVRVSALLWSYGVSANFWYGYDVSGPLWNGSALTPAGIAWTTTYNWLNGATPTNTPFCSSTGTLYTCPFTKSNKQPAELVWDSQYGPGGKTGPSDCTTASNQLICGSTAYIVPANYSTDWIDVQGNGHAFQTTVTVGAIPILLEGPSVNRPTPPANLQITVH
jgi:hypothetical protein